MLDTHLYIIITIFNCFLLIYIYIYIDIHIHINISNSSLYDISLFKPLLILMIYRKGKEGLPRNYVP